LAAAGAPIDILDEQGWTPLLWAVDADIDNTVQNGDPLELATAAALLELGADPRAVAPDGTTAMGIAAAYKCEEPLAALFARRRKSG
jgi:ankyrin repeat protein